MVVSRSSDCRTLRETEVTLYYLRLDDIKQGTNIEIDMLTNLLHLLQKHLTSVP